MHDMTFSTQRKLRLKLRINHCLLMTLHRASSCLALFSFWDLLICKSLVFEQGISYRVIYILSYWFVSFQKGVREGVLEKETFLLTKNWLNKKKFEIWIQNGKKIINLLSNHTTLEVIQHLNCSMCMVIKKNIRKNIGNCKNISPRTSCS